MRKAFVWFSGFRASATSPTDIEHDLVVIPGIIKRRDIDLSPPVGEWPLFAHSGRLESTNCVEKLCFIAALVADSLLLGDEILVDDRRTAGDVRGAVLRLQSGAARPGQSLVA